MCCTQIRGPEGGSQTVRGVPRNSHCLCLVAYHLYGKYGPEDLLADDRIVWSRAGYDGRLEISAAGFGEHALSPDSQGSPVSKSALEMFQHSLQHCLVDQWPHLGIGKQRIGREPLGGCLDDPLNHPVGHVGLDHQPGASGAHFTGVEEDRPRCRISSQVQAGGVREDDVGRLAAEFEVYPLQVAVGRIAHEVSAHFGRSSEGQHVDIRVLSQMPAHYRTVAAEHIEGTVRQTCHHAQLGDPLH
jgi:hypothetical protein